MVTYLVIVRTSVTQLSLVTSVFCGLQMERFGSVLRVSIQQFNFPISNSENTPSQMAGWELCVYQSLYTLMYSLHAGCTLALGSVVVLYTFTLSVFLRRTCAKEKLY